MQRFRWAPPVALRGAFPAALALAVLLALGPPARAADDVPRRDLVSFRVEADREVPNDRSVATVGVTEEGADPAALAARVNRRVAEARKLAAAEKAVRLSGGPATTQPVIEDGRIRRWRAWQDLVLESGDAVALAALLGQLQQQGLAMRGLRFEVAPDTRKRVEQELVVEALAALRARADLVAKSLGRKGWSLVEARIGAEGRRPVPMAALRVSAAEAAPPPVLEAGTSRLQMAVDVTVELAAAP